MSAPPNTRFSDRTTIHEQQNFTSAFSVEQSPNKSLSVAALLTSGSRASRHESCELAFERFGYAVAPARRDRLGRGVGKDFLFVFLEAIEGACRRGFGRGLRYPL
jgi:hypothetical protein